jgi:Flp pilus assembly protein TadG
MFKKYEQGQALILIVFGIIALIGMTGLAIDGGNAYSDRRNAQNAADAAALSAALANARQKDITAAAWASAATNGYEKNGVNSTVTVSVADSPAGACPGNAPGKDITVQIVSHINTYFAPVLGIKQLTNTVSATSRSCGTYTAPMFNGNAIVSLAPTGTGYSAIGTPKWNVTGGGIFSNSTSSSAAYCNGNAGINAPSVTVVGGTSFSCQTTISNITTNAAQYTWYQYKNLMPPTPKCDGTATQTGNTWYPQAGADGSKVAFSGDMNFSSGLYCVTNSPGPFHGSISGNGVTFYITSPNFSIKFNGGGNLTASAPTAGSWKGVLMYLAPQVDANGNLLNTQSLDLRGNGTGTVTGTILAPSANVTMYGNSGTAGYDSQVVGYTVTSGGTADIYVSYNRNDNYQPYEDLSAALIK